MTSETGLEVVRVMTSKTVSADLRVGLSGNGFNDCLVSI